MELHKIPRLNGVANTFTLSGTVAWSLIENYYQIHLDFSVPEKNQKQHDPEFNRKDLLNLNRASLVKMLTAPVGTKFYSQKVLSASQKPGIRIYAEINGSNQAVIAYKKHTEKALLMIVAFVMSNNLPKMRERLRIR